jgi:hypothetical protein
VIVKAIGKVLSMLLGDKKGRKFLGYVIGIALFIVLLPMIAVYGLFGWMSGAGSSEIISYDTIYNSLPTEYQEKIEKNDAQLKAIENTFSASGFTKEEISEAKAIYISWLTDIETDETFCEKYAEVFKYNEEEPDRLNRISSAFGVTFSEKDRQQYNELFGGS